AVLAILLQAGAERTEAQLLLFELMAGIAIAAIFLPRRIVRETAAVAALRQPLAFLPVTHQLAVRRILDGRFLARDDRIRDLLGWRVAVLAANFLGFILHEARLPVGCRTRPASLDGVVRCLGLSLDPRKQGAGGQRQTAADRYSGQRNS